MGIVVDGLRLLITTKLRKTGTQLSEISILGDIRFGISPNLFFIQTRRKSDKLLRSSVERNVRRRGGGGGGWDG